MRDIKFRFWNSTSGMWSWDMILQHDFFTLESLKDDEENRVMQFTGLKDVHGKEIYEGDLIRFESYIGEHVNGKVIYNDGCYFAEIISEDLIENMALGDTDQCKEPQVIGNIYENPELLQGVKK